MIVLLTRAYDDSARIAADLAGQGIESLIWPLMQIVPLGGQVHVPEGTEAVLLTSAHAAHRCRNVPGLTGLPAFCVGAATAEAARQAGFGAAVSGPGTADGLADLALRSGHTRFFYLRGREISTDLVGLLSGVHVDQCVVYGADAVETVDPVVDQALQHGQIGVATVWSARQGAILSGFASDHPAWSLAKTDLVAISENAAADLHNSGFRRILVASQPDAASMVTKISAAVRQKAEGQQL